MSSIIRSSRTTPPSTTTPTRRRIYVGFSSNELVPTIIAERSLYLHAALSRYSVHRVGRQMLRQHYTRPTSIVNDRLFDEISQAPMSTDHAIARFFVPWLCDYQGWTLFTDGDILCRRAIDDLFAHADDRYAVMCVQHPPLLGEGYKKDDQVQIPYPRKNWSSVLLLNCGHPANRALSLDYLNRVPGRDLHAFNWLPDHEIGALPSEWNYLVGVSAVQPDPAIVHFTLGTPDLPDYAYSPFSDEWYAMAKRCGMRLSRPGVAVVS